MFSLYLSLELLSSGPFRVALPLFCLQGRGEIDHFVLGEGVANNWLQFGMKRKCKSFQLPAITLVRGFQVLVEISNYSTLIILYGKA